MNNEVLRHVWDAAEVSSAPAAACKTICGLQDRVRELSDDMTKDMAVVDKLLSVYVRCVESAEKERDAYRDASKIRDAVDLCHEVEQEVVWDSIMTRHDAEIATIKELRNENDKLRTMLSRTLLG